MYTRLGASGRWPDVRRAATIAPATIRIAETRSIAVARRFHPPAHVLLNAEELRALERRQELRELALLGLDGLQPVAGELHRLVEELPNAILVRLVAGVDLAPQLEPQLALAPNEIAPLRLETLIGLLQPSHLVVVQLELHPHDLRQSGTELTLHRLPIFGTITTVSATTFLGNERRG
jgi:hypothetical protein